MQTACRLLVWSTSVEREKGKGTAALGLSCCSSNSRAVAAEDRERKEQSLTSTGILISNPLSLSPLLSPVLYASSLSSVEQSKDSRHTQHTRDACWLNNEEET